MPKLATNGRLKKGLTLIDVIAINGQGSSKNGQHPLPAATGLDDSINV